MYSGLQSLWPWLNGYLAKAPPQQKLPRHPYIPDAQVIFFLRQTKVGSSATLANTQEIGKLAMLVWSDLWHLLRNMQSGCFVTVVLRAVFSASLFGVNGYLQALTCCLIADSLAVAMGVRAGEVQEAGEAEELPISSNAVHFRATVSSLCSRSGTQDILVDCSTFSGQSVFVTRTKCLPPAGDCPTPGQDWRVMMASF